MDSYKVPRNRWDYRFISFMRSLRGPGTMDDLTNFCDYWRAFIVESLLVLLLGFVSLTLVVCTFSALGWIFFTYTEGSIFIELAKLGWMFIFLGIIIFGTSAVMYWLEDRKLAVHDKEPSVFVQKYRSWKDKVCPQLEYIDEE